MRVRLRHLDGGQAQRLFGWVWAGFGNLIMRWDSISDSESDSKSDLGMDPATNGTWLHTEWMIIKCNQLGQVRKGSQSDANAYNNFNSSNNNNNNNIIISIFLWSGTKRATDGLAQKQQQQQQKEKKTDCWLVKI